MNWYNILLSFQNSRLLTTLFCVFALIPMSAKSPLKKSVKIMHKEHVHQHIVQEAYRFLEKEIGVIPILKDYVGLGYFGPGENNFHWDEQAAVSVGAWQEDLFDALLGNMGVMGACVTSTHFWTADNGDDAYSSIEYCGQNINAFWKSRSFFGGSDYEPNFTFTKDGLTQMQINGSWQYMIGARYRYDNLCHYATSGEATLKNVVTILGETIQRNKDIVSDVDIRRKWAFNILGRMLHLLADMSVPAHTMEDIHPCDTGDPEYYELWMGSNETGDCNAHHQTFTAQTWNHQNIRDQGGLLMEVFDMDDYSALRYLYYTLNQLTNHFSSTDYAGNNDLPHGTTLTLNSRYAYLGSTPDDANNTEIADETFKYCIRATATLMYWFSAKIGIVNCPNIRYLQSEKFYGARDANETTKITAKDYIFAGSNVRNDISTGPYVVESPARLDILAGKEIALKSGVHFKSGSNVNCRIVSSCNLGTTNCSITQSIMNNDELKKLNQSSRILSNVDSVQRMDVYLYNGWNNQQYGTDSLVFTNIWKYTPVYGNYSSTIDTNRELPFPQLWFCDTIRVFNEADSMTELISNRATIRFETDRAVIITNLDSSQYNYTDNSPRIHNIYPNPNSDYIDMQIDGRGSSSTVTIYTQMGVKISETTVGSSEKLSRVSTSGLAPGMYMAIVKTAKGKTSKNFVVHR